jgi:transcriptional regulator with GAF, ATPase, and Fis domain
VLGPEEFPLPDRAAASEGEGDSLDDAERRHVVAILRRTGGNKRAACRILGISRPRLDRIIARHRIEVTERGQGGNGA